MISERVDQLAFGLARKTRKRYLTKALEREDLGMLKTIGLDGWSIKDRKEEYRQVVLPYWKKFGLAPKQEWFELYGSRDHRMDPRFLPADLYYTAILPYLNNGLQFRGLSNKGYYDYLFPDVRQPQTVALKIEGTYYDESRRVIREKDAVDLCLERNTELFLKVSTGSAKGAGIFPFSPGESTAEDVREIFGKAGPSFIVQERIRQHPALHAMNPSSVSTIRVVSLLFEDKVYVESAGLRVSGPGTRFVSVLDDGFFTEIRDDGTLNPKVFSDFGLWFEDGKGLFADSFQLPSIDRVYDEVKRIHPRMGHFKCIGWDFAIDDRGEPVMIEFNVFPALGIPQITRCKPAFNDKTDWILEDYFHRRTWAKNHRQDILIQ